MIEKVLVEYLTEEIPEAEVQWGKLYGKDVDWTVPQISVQLSSGAAYTWMPTYADDYQITVRTDSIDTSAEYANKVITALQTYRGDMKGTRVWVGEILTSGSLYEEEDIVATILIVPIKYTQK